MVTEDRKWSSTNTDPTGDQREYYDGYPADFDSWPDSKKYVWLLEQQNNKLDKLLKARQPPTTPFRTNIVLNDDNWKPLTNLIRWGQIRTWKLRNMTHRLPRPEQQLIEFAYMDDPEPFEIDDIGPGGMEVQDTWPEDLWVHRTTSTNDRAFFPIVLVEIWFVKDLSKPEYQPLWEDLATTKTDKWREESIKVQGFDENDLYPTRY